MVLTEIRVEAGKIVLHSGDHDHQRTGAQAEQHQQPVARAEWCEDTAAGAAASSPPSPAEGFRCE